ncbi:MAG: type I methionyl aminopeptidase [Clostridia bacterium]|nr:type I methionyl aminopeptidase [Clostridia bacterium]
MITLKNSRQIEKMRIAGRLLGQVLNALREMVKPGITTSELDKAAEKMIRDAGALPSFKGYEGFPATICASPDDGVVHGFPNHKPLLVGQIISVDCGLSLEGWQADSAFTSPVGDVKPELAQLIKVTEECFWLGFEQAKPGNRLGDISHAVEQHAKEYGYGVIRDLCGHGIGRKMHEDPSIPNYGESGKGIRLREGMTIAVEPMIALGDWRVKVREDGWTVVTRDHRACSHYEHTIAITEDGPQALTFVEKTEAEDE